jgi:hypothetical protein
LKDESATRRMRVHRIGTAALWSYVTSVCDLCPYRLTATVFSVDVMTIKSDKTIKNGKKASAPRLPGLAEEVRESARAGQHAASRALRDFRRTVDDAIPDVVEPLRARIVDAAIELADELVTAQFKFHRSIVRSADRALTKSVTSANGDGSRGRD